MIDNWERNYYKLADRLFEAIVTIDRLRADNAKLTKYVKELEAIASGDYDLVFPEPKRISRGAVIGKTVTAPPITIDIDDEQA